ncbi:SgcJ/EcaC family oxidoreductase [Parafrankia elaeagni]|uniref:SgcJ/EcaC family oxidoreductase n=1 Tax=Parafrankia elaeagni TaxID=222534 RepID=UPI0003732FA5|nr:SgcJ/EcaC family oxidoreductase [Parafrankia elaeagni]
MAANDPSALLGAYEHAFNTNDARAMNDLFADEPVFVNFGGQLVHGKADLYRAQEFVFGPGGPLEHVRVRYLVLSTIFLSTDVAVVHSRQRSLAADGALVETDTDPMEAMFTVVLTMNGGPWRIRVGQNTPVTRP